MKIIEKISDMLDTEEVKDFCVGFTVSYVIGSIVLGIINLIFKREKK